jgi:hypothetical protein
MKLGKLLAAGKSIMNGRVEVSYRASKQVYLPKFGPAKNPFKTETPEPSPEAAAVADSTVVPPVAPRPVRAESLETPTAVPINSMAVIAQELPPLPVISEKKKTNWAGKLNPASIFRRHPEKSGLKPLDGAAGAQKTTTTQAELSLDTVKVVHNDLSDADVEVVPIKSRSAPPDLQPAKASWEVLGEQLFGVKTM